MTTTHDLVLGIDFGTDSCRSVIVDTVNGEEISSAVFSYPRWTEGRYSDPGKNRFRQHPKDYLEAFEESVKAALRSAPEGTSSLIRGIGIDTTGSTPAAVDSEGTPLALLPSFEENPNAMFILWKDHTAVREAEEINELARTWGGPDYTVYEGGVYSSEWFWAKILHVLREDAEVRNAAYSWVEHCDWMSAVLTGNSAPLTMKRSRCAAGHKAMWHDKFGGLPDEDFLTKLDPILSGLRSRLYRDTYTSDTPAGTLTDEWSQKLGLPGDVVVNVGGLDAHVGAVGGEIHPGSLLKVVGTSTCDMIIMPTEEAGDLLVEGICGQVDGSIVPGMLGMEAGQSAFGDIYAWFKDLLAWPLNLISASNSGVDTEALKERILPGLSKAAERIDPSESGVIALDWLNGRRTPYADQTLTGAITGLRLGSDAPTIFRALVDATAFGSRKIMERFIEAGVEIEDVIAVGGVAKKSPLVMQVLSDVLNKQIRVSKSEQTVALGAAMFAAVAAGLFKDVSEAQQAMGSGFEMEYKPNPKNAAAYDGIYRKYLTLGNFIEKQTREESK